LLEILNYYYYHYFVFHLLLLFNIFYWNYFDIVDTDKLSLLSSRLETAEQELLNAELDKKLAAINSAKISQVSLIIHRSVSIHFISL